ncbi:MAG: uridine-cytidine kinase [Chitinophagales bacterium]
MNQKPYIVGVAGGSASGKTSFLKVLKKRMPEGSVSIVSQDNYYKPFDTQEKDENGEVNFDLPTAICRESFHRDLQALMAGNTVRVKEYTFNNSAKISGEIELAPAPVIVMEGLFIFHYNEIRSFLDLKVYIDAKEDIKLKRRILRDATERGYAENTVRYQWDQHVVPSYKKFLRPYRDNSDIIITNNVRFDKGLDVLISHLNTKI